ncbi:MAG: secondary thiamine-phosphate synthase enzyme YjbQ [Bacteroidales bacterium]|nr:secondary thiamine-phosphate synthase enzyme YjbQ [Bacteroidales bacterium]
MVIQKQIVLKSRPQGFHLITNEILDQLDTLPENGILHLFLEHTSAALTINENADITVRNDMERFYNKLVPPSYKEYEHIMEGLDDMPAHIKTSIIGQTLTIPIVNKQLHLGTWQGIYLCEFRKNAGPRKIFATIIY